MTIQETRLWTALVTPMNDDGEIDISELASLIHLQDEANNGVLILGSTGEGMALSLDDKKKVVETASGLNINTPLMAGVGGYNLRNQIEWIEFCHSFDIDSFLLVTPLYAKPAVKGQIAWFTTLLDTAERPCMIYNVPSRTGVKLEPEVIEELSDHPNLAGLKEASGEVSDFLEFRKAAPELPIYSGDDGMTPFFAAAGCQGLISVMSNVWPKAANRYLDWCLQNRGPELLPLWDECSAALFKAPNPIPVKVLLAKKGLIKSDALRLPLTADEIDDPQFLLNADRRIRRWYQSSKKEESYSKK
jgi:4-hydroxy-tetrahydrodipicolinate synthase